MIYIIPTDTCYGIGCPLHELKDYNKIYKIKKRNLSKPLAIMVEDFKWLKNNTDLTIEQIEFLKKYNKPFTILTNSNPVNVWINFIDEDGNEFLNKDIYEQIAFRVAHNDIQKRIIKENGPIFLTSANLSKKPEIYKASEIKKEFEYYLDKQKSNKEPVMTFLGANTGNLEENGTSDIFEFNGDSLEIEYLRKN